MAATERSEVNSGLVQGDTAVFRGVYWELRNARLRAQRTGTLCSLTSRIGPAAAAAAVVAFQNGMVCVDELGLSWPTR